MKLLIFKLQQGEYDSAYETIDSIYSTENSNLTAENLVQEWELFLQSEATKWKAEYKANNGKNPHSYQVQIYLSDTFNFKKWIAENYSDLVQITDISEGYIHENYV